MTYNRIQHLHCCQIALNLPWTYINIHKFRQIGQAHYLIHFVKIYVISGHTYSCLKKNKRILSLFFFYQPHVKTQEKDFPHFFPTCTQIWVKSLQSLSHRLTHTHTHTHTLTILHTHKQTFKHAQNRDNYI